MTRFLEINIALPLLGFVLCMLIPGHRESTIARVALLAIGTQAAFMLATLFSWVFLSEPLVEVKSIVLFNAYGFEIFADFIFDRLTATFGLIGVFLALMVMFYSRTYLHREQGYKRFFCTVLLFYLGYSLVIFAGNMETMFIGWEILGVTSFLLIAFYRERYLPVKNAVKVFSIYRTGDVGLLLATWMMHHVFGSTITFEQLQQSEYITRCLHEHSVQGPMIGLMLLLAAAVKSAQLPFSSWLPRAMEGPTPSSAIFYGSLAVHMGVFLLLRTQAIWSSQPLLVWSIALLGLATSIVATLIARTQSAIKSQIAYASVAQIGLIFIEVALGFDAFALVHFAGNAFLRTYQLLVSPSVVTYLIREQFYRQPGSTLTIEEWLPKRFQYTLYLLSLREFHLDRLLYEYLWHPMKVVGRSLTLLTARNVVIGLTGFYLFGVLLAQGMFSLPDWMRYSVTLMAATLGLLNAMRGFAERRRVYLSWLLALVSHYWIALAIAINASVNLPEILLYLSGVTAAGLVGLTYLRQLEQVEGNVDLDQFHGYVRDHRRTAFIFLLCGLCGIGFPISPTLLGEDLMISHIRDDQVILAALISLNLIVVGLAIIRIYARVFLGPHGKSSYAVDNRSA